MDSLLKDRSLFASGALGDWVKCPEWGNRTMAFAAQGGSWNHESILTIDSPRAVFALS